MTLKSELEERGLVAEQSVDDLARITEDQKRHLYVGFDPTAESLHIGHLIPFIVARHFLRWGHQVTILVGDGTAMIGDPSGRSEERKLLDQATVEANSQKIQTQIGSLFDEREFPVVNNSHWLNKLSLIEFLRETGKHFTIGNLLQKEYIKNRLAGDQGLSYTEFSYSLIQAYDFYHLHLERSVDLQIGGADQWGNVSSGVDFIRRKTGQEVFGLTAPLITNKSTGRKFGKTETGAVWLDPEKTSPYQFYQFWLNTDDQGVGEYLRYYTFLPLERVEEIERHHRQAPEERLAQRSLAQEMTAMIHGETRTEQVIRISDLLFSDQPINELSSETLRIIIEEVPTVTKSQAELEHGLTLVELMVESSLAGSKREAREYIRSGAVLLNRLKVTDQTYQLGAGDLINSTAAVIQRGKRQLAAVKVK